MAFSYDELKKKTVAQLREIASKNEHEALKGYTQLNKEHLLKALCGALGIKIHAHQVVASIDKTAIKQKIKQLKAKAAEALAAKNYKELSQTRRKIHGLKHELRMAIV